MADLIKLEQATGDFITQYAVFKAVNRFAYWSWNGWEFTPDERDILEFDTLDEAEECQDEIGEGSIEKYERYEPSPVKVQIIKRAQEWAETPNDNTPLMAAE